RGRGCAQGAGQAGGVLIAGYRLVIGGSVEQLVKEVLDMGRVLLRLRVGLRPPDQLQKAEPIRIGIAAALRHRLPEIVAEAVGVLGAVVAQMAEAVVAIDHEFQRGGAAGDGDPDRRRLGAGWTAAEMVRAYCGSV